MIRFPFWFAVLLSLSILLAGGNSLVAQDKPADEPTTDPLGLFGDGPPRPFATVTLASVEGSLADIAWVFGVAERPDMMELLEKVLKDNVRDLKGLDRTRPAGVMVFMQPSLPPRPVPVAYIPVSDLNDLLKTMDLGPLKTQKVEGTENRYELVGRRNTQHIIVREGYLYISQNEDYATNEDLPIPADFAPPLASKYDIAVSLDLTAIPSILRDAFLSYLRSQAEADLQRRDEEPEGAYIVRRTNGITMLENLEQALSEGEKITLGLEASPEQEKVTLDLSIDAKPGSDYAEILKATVGRPSAFQPLTEDEDQPLSISACWIPNQRDRKAYAEYVRALETGLKNRMTESDGGTLSPASQATISRICDPIRSTIDDEQMDLCFQFRQVSASKFVIIGALRVVGGDTLGTGLQELISRAKELDPNLDNLELNVAQHEGVNIHRLQGKDALEGRKGPLGESPSAYVAASNRTAWLAVGGPEALDELKFSIDKMIAAGEAPRTGSTAPFKMVLRASKWLKLPPDNDREDEGREVAVEAFKPAEDALRIEARPTDSGARIRIQLDKSFVRFVGLMIARQYDKSQL